jgi:hypothetical protein
VEDVKFSGAIHAEPQDTAASYTVFSRDPAFAVGGGGAGAKGKQPNRDAVRQTKSGQPPILALSEVIISFLSSNIRLALEVISAFGRFSIYI